MKFYREGRTFLLPHSLWRRVEDVGKGGFLLYGAN